MDGTTVSVIIPVYNVEAYLDECLTSVREQQHHDLEIIVVDDGSPDGSAVIADKHAAEDPRICVIHQENRGLGAARNTGIKQATGDYYCFVDSDDVLPVDSVTRMVATATRSGSDIVAGAALRYNSTRRWRPDWVELHGQDRLGFRVEEWPEIIRNNYTWGKLYRASFWRACDLWFREGVSYEDQPIITQLFVRASGIDVIPTITYKWRQRDDQSSISQQMHTLRDLKDRVSAWDESHEALSAEAPSNVYETWLTTLFATHLHWYLNNESTADDNYWNTLQETVERVTADAPDSLTEILQPQHRVAIELTRRDLREEFHEFKRLGGYTLSNFRGRLTTHGLMFELPTYGDPELAIPDELYVLNDEQIPLVHRVDRTAWTWDGSLRVEGWACFRYVDLTDHATTISLTLRNERTGEEISAVGEQNPGHTFLGPVNDRYASYEAGAFAAELPLAARLAANPPKPGDTWALSMRVQTDRLDRAVKVTRVNQSGSGRFLAPLRYQDGFLHRTDLALARPFQLQYQERRVSVDELTLDGSTLAGRLNPPTATEVSLTNVTSADSSDVPIAMTADGNYSISLPPGPYAADTSHQFPEWSMRALLAGRPAPVTVDADLVEGVHGRSGSVVYSVRQSHRGAVLVQPSPSLVDLSHADISDDVLVVSGSVPTVEAGTLTLSLRAVKATSTPVMVDFVDGGFTARIPLVYSVWRYGDQALPSTSYTLCYELRVPDGTTSDGEVQVSYGLTLRLPWSYESNDFAVTATRATGRALQLQLFTPIGREARGAYQRRRLEEAHKAREGSEHLEGLLIETNFGEIAGDNGIAVHQELQRRSSHLRVYWAVKDRSVIVPDGGSRWFATAANGSRDCAPPSI
ncbi:MAG: glycosyltransferase family 2 protein [Nocardioidaceae bacterium]